ncbi:DNA (cytosine-5-)-methyltransferase [Pseudomonas anatoliensis]|uniref:DNA cytosine methyltransferase n=1 Tax=Pseudomonas anatoliensis TaxID=2710589 RepID=UPI001B3427B8|nr:DNA (cytosine-5-)-methyltransferase [Pseudomonas anatoliensis]MBP5955509.1 DNA (cytosine-5-)-methyltransferase [Pseudomonas anatoliensis]
MNDFQINLNLPEDAIPEPIGLLAEPIQVVDLFAGPGGLGEGFTSSGGGNRFEIVISAEKDSKAWQTLRLRAFYRLLKKRRPDLLFEYYNYCNDPKAPSIFVPSRDTEPLWDEAAIEAKCITLGSDQGNKTLDEALNNRLKKDRPWVLIGGPPCQAYSIVGRSRNQSKINYKAEDDHRHFLYKEYLRIIRERQPTMFVMENVKGILSSKVNNERIFSNILRDLSDPGQTLLEGSAEKKKYRIYSLVTGASFGPGEDVDKIDPRAFIIRAEDYGIPQARHRVILLGIATDSLPASIDRVKLSTGESKVSVGEVLRNLPRLRSGLSKTADSQEGWIDVVLEQLDYLRKKIDPVDVEFWGALQDLSESFDFPKAPLSSGGKRVKRTEARDDGSTENSSLDEWYLDRNLGYWLNHESRGHMPTDLRRYLFAAVYAKLNGVSPKGHKEFSIKGLAPDHKNWKTGKFSDRFRVQLENRYATTITSHISKDGHYFIHYDPTQCRSLSVREAARIQTFPDNYFFQGSRTDQFHQVGNAVPPLLASKISKVVFGILFDKVKNYDESQALQKLSVKGSV